MKKYIIALDQGTTSSRAFLFDKLGNEVSKVQKTLSSTFPEPGWVEQDPMEIISSQLGVLTELISLNNINPVEIDSIGITNQRETTIVWNRYTGLPIYNAIVWQSRQSADIISTLIDEPTSKVIQDKTGLRPDAYFSASKIRWILDHVDGAQKQAENGDLLFGTVDTWLLHQLTNQTVHLTDYTNASRTMIFNINTLTWDEELLDLFNIPKSMLPKVVNSSELVGYYNYGGHQIPITSMVGDQQAALFGQTCFEKGSLKNTYGTGCFLLMNTGDTLIHSKQGLVSSIGIAIDDKIEYVLEGSVFSAGSILTWLQSKMHLIDKVHMSSDMAKSVNDDENVIMIPSFTGLGAPYWRRDTLGSLVNLTFNVEPKHIIKAALDSVALQTYDVTQALLEDSQIPINSVFIDGGMASNEYLMQYQSNVLNKDVIRSQTQEATALGAAYLAGLATGFFKNKEQLKSFTRIEKVYKPNITKLEQSKILNQWKNAIEHHLTHNKSND